MRRRTTCAHHDARSDKRLRLLLLTMTQGATNSTGIPPTGSLTLSPNAVQPLPIGGQQAFTVFASDASGAPVPNVSVGLEVTGVDNRQLSGTTSSSGYATIVYNDVNPGTAYVQADRKSVV